MRSELKQPRKTPVDGYDVVEEPQGAFKVMAGGEQVGGDFESFSAAYFFVQKRVSAMTPRRRESSKA